MHKLLILLSSLAAAGLPAGAGGHPHEAATVSVPGTAYDVSLVLTQSGRTLGTPRVTMRDGERTSLRSERDGWMVQLELDRVPSPAGEGGERLMIDTRLFLMQNGRWELAVSPTMVATLGEPVRAEIAGGPEGPGPVGIAVTIVRAAEAPAATVRDAPRTRPHFQSLVTAEDYPASALRSGEQGMVRFTLDVGPNGRVTRCTVDASSGSPALDSTTCRLMTARARFRPAYDPAGDAVASTHSGSVEWKLPPGGPPPIARPPVTVVATPPPPTIFVPRSVPAPPPAVATPRRVEPARPRATLQRLIGLADYPASSLRAGERGDVGVELVVGVNGRVTGCTITRSSGYPALDSATCRLLQSRARFIPARDSNGTLTEDSYRTTIRWWYEDEPAAVGRPSIWLPDIPVPQPRPLRPPRSLIGAADYPASALRAGEQGRTRVLLEVGPNGRATGCTVTSSSGSSALDSATCRLLVARARFTPARGPDGEPVTSRFLTEMDWVLPATAPTPQAASSRPR